MLAPSRRDRHIRKVKSMNLAAWVYGSSPITFKSNISNKIIQVVTHVLCVANAKLCNLCWALFQEFQESVRS